MKLSWKAVRQGARYCAPACGRGCTWAEYQAAKKSANALAKKMGPGWTPVVAENMGWWYRVTASIPGVEVWLYPSGKSAYWCSLTIAGQRYNGDAAKPKEAWQRAVEAAQRDHDSLGAALRIIARSETKSKSTA